MNLRWLFIIKNGKVSWLKFQRWAVIQALRKSLIIYLLIKRRMIYKNQELWLMNNIKKVCPKWMNYVPDGISKFFGWHKRYVEATEPLRRFLLCMDILHQDISSVIIKVHPTAKYSQSLRTIYQSYGYKVASEQFIPWEVYLLNHAADNKLLIS